MSVFVSIDRRFWRMLNFRWQRDPLSGSGTALTGGRWNRPGQRALYLASDHATAIAEFHQDVLKPGTLVAYDVDCPAIADLTNPTTLQALAIDPESLLMKWKRIVQIERAIPPGWVIAEQLLAAGVHGALVPSAQYDAGVNLVLWRWSGDPNGGARVAVIDPDRDLS